jgi:hypothetical protein
MSIVAASRPDSWNFPLFVHVLGAMVLVGGVVAGSSVLAFARGRTQSLRLGYWALLAVALPGYIVMRVGAEWIYSREGWDKVDNEPSWLGIGYIIADAGALVLLLALILGGVGIRRLRQEKGAGFLRATLILSFVLLAAYVVAIWAMAGKPD